MSVDARRLGLSAGVIAGTGYTICALFVPIAPEVLSRVFGFVMHMDLSGVTWSISLISYVVGVLVYSAIVGVHVWLAAALYNRLTRRVQP